MRSAHWPTVTVCVHAVITHPAVRLQLLLVRVHVVSVLPRPRVDPWVVGQRRGGAVAQHGQHAGGRGAPIAAASAAASLCRQVANKGYFAGSMCLLRRVVYHGRLAATAWLTASRNRNNKCTV